MDFINEINREFFFKINGRWHHPLLDPVMYWVSEEKLWIAVAVIVAAFLFYKRNVSGLKVFTIVAIAFALSDSISFNILKPAFNQPRPCQEFAGLVRLLDGCAGLLGLPSNHAANSAAVASAIAFAGRIRLALFLIPVVFLVGYSRIYLGVHYPMDILVGFMCGPVFGYLAVVIFASAEKLWRRRGHKPGF